MKNWCEEEGNRKAVCVRWIVEGRERGAGVNGQRGEKDQGVLF